MRTPLTAETFLVGVVGRCDSFPEGHITYFRLEWNQNQSIFDYLKNEKDGTDAQNFIMREYPGYRTNNYPSDGDNVDIPVVENVSELIEVAKDINQKEPDTSIQYVIVYEVEKSWSVWNINGNNIPIVERTIGELFTDIISLGYDLIDNLDSIRKTDVSLSDNHEEKISELIKLTRIVKRKVGDHVT